MLKSGKAVIAAAALVVLVGACGSSSSKGSSSGGSTPPSNSNSGSSSSSPGTSSSGTATISDLITKSKTADIKVTYKDDESGTSFTLVRRGNDSVFTSGSSSLYSVGNKATSCSGTGSGATCTEVQGVGSLTSAFSASVLGVWTQLVESAAKLPAFANVKASTATIAGRDAKCVTISGELATAGKSGSVCVDAENGILLRVQSNGKTVFEATSVGQPSDGDFKLPAKPTTVTLPSGMTLPSISVPSTP